MYRSLAYSEQEEYTGVYCLSCILFPTQPKNDSRVAKLITTPYTNWKKATDYLFSHADECEYHKTLYNRFDAFHNTQNNPSIRIDQRMINSASETFGRNKRFLKSILRVLEYLERQGLALQGRRDDGAALGDDAINKGNLKRYLILCRTPASLCVITLKRALEILPISLKRPRTLCWCWSASKTIMQGKIVDEIN